MYILVNRARNAISWYITNLKQHIIAKFVVSRECGKFWGFSVPSIILADLLGKNIFLHEFKNDEHKSRLLSLNNDRTPKEQQVTAVLLLAEKIGHVIGLYYYKYCNYPLPLWGFTEILKQIKSMEHDMVTDPSWLEENQLEILQA